MAILKKKTEDAPKTESTAKNSLAYVLLQPRVSEKASRLATQDKYVFLVRPEANKITIKKAVESFYKVKVVMVNIVKTDGKTRNFGRTAGRTSDFKKAIVTLKKGEKIELA